MRDILFRGKRTDNGEWVYGYYTKARYYLNEKEMHVIFAPDGEAFPRCEFSDYEEVDPETVCQFTGLYDRNGGKSVEGDIILYHHKVKKLVPCEDATQEEILHHGLDPESGFGLAYRPKRTIRYKGNVTIDPICGTDLNLNNNCQWWRCENDGQLTSVEIIGNIYDNPELLGRMVKQNG